MELEILSEAEGILRSGGIIIAPTDTVYGILGDATNVETIKNIFLLKQRSLEKAFPVFVKSVAEARKYAYISDAKAKFLASIWPGPATVVLHHKGKLPRILTGDPETIGVRVPKNEFLLQLLSRLDFPLVQTSANISSKPTAQNTKEIKAYFGNQELQPDLIIDGGETTRQHSTLIGLTGNEPRLLRTGAVTKKELDKVFQSMQP